MDPIPMVEVARMLSKTVQEARRWVKRNDCGEQRGRYWFLIPDLFLKNFPHLRERMQDAEDYTVFGDRSES